MTTPAIRVLLQVFIGQGIFKGAAMQIQGHDITRRERVLRQLRQEEFIDDASTGNADPALRRPGGMGRDHHSAPESRRPDGYIRAVVKGAYHLAFRSAELLVWGEVQAGLDLGSVKELVVLASHHIREASQVSYDGSRAILPIQP